MTSQSAGLTPTLIALRGVILIIAGLFAFAYPLMAVRFLVFVGGGILLVDGVLNLATLKWSPPRDLAFWVGVVRSALAVLAGLMLVLSPWLLTFMSIETIRTFIGVQAIGIGILEICGLLLPYPKAGDQILPVLISGGTYALLGLALILLPAGSAVVVTQIGAVLVIVFALSLLFDVWKRRVRARSA